MFTVSPYMPRHVCIICAHKINKIELSHIQVRDWVLHWGQEIWLES